MKTTVKLFAILVGVFASATAAFADPATGWKQTAAGTYVYDNPDNWVGGIVNGVFGNDLTLAGAQTITFTNDYTLANGLTINYAGNYAMTFQSNGTGAKTLTLGGDISEALQGNASAIVTIGGSGDDALVLDLAGENRTITAAATVSDVSKSGILSIPAVIQNGALTINGAKKLNLSGANTYAGGTTIAGATYLYVNSATALGTGDVSINAAANLCSDATRTMTANNNFYINATDWYFRGGSALDIGTGDMVATNSFKLWAEADGLTIHGPIVDKDGNLAPWKLEKWGSKSLNTYSYATMSGDESFVVGNGIWNFYGEISGSGFSVDGSVSTLSKYFKLKAANSFSGTLSLEGDNLFVHADVANAIPSGAVVAFGQGVAFVGSSGQKVSDLLADGKVSTDSTGTICLGSSESGAIDLSGHPGLVLGAKGGTYDCTGTITWPASGTIRLGGGGDALKFSVPDTIPEGRDIDIVGKLFIAASNSTAGKIRVVNGGLLIIDGAAGTLPNAQVVVEQGGELSLRSSVACDVTRANNVTVKSGTLSFEGNKTYAVVHRITKLTLDTMENNGGTPQMKWSSKDSKQTTLYIGEIVRPTFCFLNLASGGTLGASEFTSGWNIAVANGAENMGVGTAGTTTTPVVPWIRHDGHFVYNDPSRGLRFLDGSTERETYSAAATLSGPTTAGENMYFNTSAGGTLELTGESMDITSFAFGYQGKTMTLTSPNGKLNVTSGGIFCDGNTQTYLDATTDFGENRGYIMDRAGKAQYLRGVIKGTGGLTIGNYSTANGNGSTGTGINCAFTNSTFTGDVHIFGRVDEVQNGCFPYGERSGNTYLHGYWLCGNYNVSLNGLSGAGYMQLGNSFNITYTVGSDGSDGDYDGRIYRSNGTFTLVKTGSGRQRMGGTCNHNGATTVSGGTLIVDGEFTASSVTVAEGAALGGSGGITNTVAFASGAKLAVTATNDVASCLTVAGTVSSGGPVTVNATVASGKWQTAQCVLKSNAAITANFVKGDGIGLLELRNNDTELWATPKTSGFYIIIR